MKISPTTAPRRSSSAAAGTADSASPGAASSGAASAAPAMQDIAADARNAISGFREWACTELFFVDAERTIDHPPAAGHVSADPDHRALHAMEFRSERAGTGKDLRLLHR